MTLLWRQMTVIFHKERVKLHKIIEYTQVVERLILTIDIKVIALSRGLRVCRFCFIWLIEVEA